MNKIAKRNKPEQRNGRRNPLATNNESRLCYVCGERGSRKLAVCEHCGSGPWELQRDERMEPA